MACPDLDWMIVCRVPAGGTALRRRRIPAPRGSPGECWRGSNSTVVAVAGECWDCSCCGWFVETADVDRTDGGRCLRLEVAAAVADSDCSADSAVVAVAEVADN